MQITQDAVLYTCRLTGTAHVPGISQGLLCPFEVLEQLHSAVTQAQPQEPGPWGSESGTAQLLAFLFPPRKLPSITATKPFLRSPAATNPSANWLWEDALALPSTAALHVATAAADRPQTAPSSTWRREWQRFLPNFS